MNIETTSCLICGSIEYAPRWQLRDWAYELPGEFQLVTCRACGHVYQNPRPTLSSIGAYYPDDYTPFRRAIDDEPNAILRAIRHRQWRTRCMQVARLRDGGRLLDVGASTGMFLNELRRYGSWTLAGVELSERAAQYARDTFQLNMFTGQIEAAPWPPASFDVITAWDVVEHLPEPRAALIKMRDLIKDDGYIIVSVPNGDSFDAKIFGRYWIGLDPPRHMSVFNLDGLRRLMQSAGFEIETAYCFYGRYTTSALSWQMWLHAHLRPSTLRRLIERMLFVPVWRYITLPYFWTIDQLRRGAIITVRARPGRAA